MAQSTLLQQTNKQKIGESLVQSDNQIKNAKKNIISFMNQVKTIYENNQSDQEIVDACIEIYNNNLDELRAELDNYTKLT